LSSRRPAGPGRRPGPAAWCSVLSHLGWTAARIARCPSDPAGLLVTRMALGGPVVGRPGDRPGGRCAASCMDYQHIEDLRVNVAGSCPASPGRIQCATGPARPIWAQRARRGRSGRNGPGAADLGATGPARPRRAQRDWRGRSGRNGTGAADPAANGRRRGCLSAGGGVPSGPEPTERAGTGLGAAGAGHAVLHRPA
jgi:hypothetical protein